MNSTPKIQFRRALHKLYSSSPGSRLGRLGDGGKPASSRASDHILHGFEG